MTSTCGATLEARGLRVTFGGGAGANGAALALDGVDLVIGPGEVLGVVGPAGAGKSTLLRALAGLQCIDAGSIWLEGERVDRLPERQRARWRRQVGMAFQNNALFDDLTVFDNVALPLRQRRIPRIEIDLRVHALLDAVGLLAAATKFPGQLSGGMRKRVAVARAAVSEPAVGLFDEPVAGLDPESAACLVQMLGAVARGCGMAAVIVSNQLALLRLLCARVLMLCEGRTLYDGPPGAMLCSHQPAVREFATLASP